MAQRKNQYTSGNDPRLLTDSDYVIPNYQSKTMQLLFDPAARFYAKNQIQTQLVFNGYNQGQVIYKQKYYDQNYKQAADKYLADFKDNIGRMGIFNTTLRQRISASKKSVKQYDLQQIAEFFPWVMSCKMLFDPIRVILYCVSQNMDVSTANDIKQKLPASMINNVVNKAIYQCIRYNSPYIQLVMQIYRDTPIGFIAKLWSVKQAAHEALKDGLKVIDDASSFLANIGTNVYNAIGSGFNSVANYFRDKNRNIGNQSINLQQIQKEAQDKNLKAKQVTNYKNTILALLSEIFGGLRCYGQITINYNYLAKAGWTKNIQGQLYYYFPDQPFLLFLFKNSFPTVYYLNDTKLELIPQSQFTKKFLIGLITADVLRLGGRILKQVKIDTTQNQQNQAMQKFSQKYLGWNDGLKIMPYKNYSALDKLYNGTRTTLNVKVASKNIQQQKRQQAAQNKNPGNAQKTIEMPKSQESG